MGRMPAITVGKSPSVKKMKIIKWFPLTLVLLVVSYVSASNFSNFNLADLNGKEHYLSDFKGKWVVVNYWATWCPPCRKEIPELIAFHDQHQKTNDAVVLGVDFENLDVKSVKNFLQKYMVSYTILLAEPEARTPLGRVDALPTTFIVAPNGEVVLKKTGKVDAKYLEKTIAQLKQQLGMTSEK